MIPKFLRKILNITLKFFRSFFKIPKNLSKIFPIVTFISLTFYVSLYYDILKKRSFLNFSYFPKFLENLRIWKLFSYFSHLSKNFLKLIILSFSIIFSKCLSFIQKFTKTLLKNFTLYLRTFLPRSWQFLHNFS